MTTPTLPHITLARRLLHLTAASPELHSGYYFVTVASAESVEDRFEGRIPIPHTERVVAPDSTGRLDGDAHLAAHPVCRPAMDPSGVGPRAAPTTDPRATPDPRPPVLAAPPLRDLVGVGGQLLGMRRSSPTPFLCA